LSQIQNNLSLIVSKFCQFSIKTKFYQSSRVLVSVVGSSEEEDEEEVDVEECSDGEGGGRVLSVASTPPRSKPASVEPDSGSEGRASPASVASRRRKRSSDSPAATPVIPARCNCPELLGVDCRLETKELWDKFHDLGTEMIITKTGR